MINWRKSTRSCAGDCVEVGATTGTVHVRDSKNPDMPHLHLTREQFGSLLDRVRAL